MNHLLNKTFVSFDLETLSTKQNGVIVSIGAVFFTIEGGLTKEFSVNIDSHSSLEYNLDIELETINWWAEQPINIRRTWQVNKQSLPDALNQFNTFLADVDWKTTFMLANGAVFDFGLIRSSYEATGIKRPWPHWVELDLRTIAVLVDTRLSKGNTHSALEDAKNQAEQFISLFNE
jgi:hypothetical protein